MVEEFCRVQLVGKCAVARRTASSLRIGLIESKTFDDRLGMVWKCSIFVLLGLFGLFLCVLGLLISCL
jgi:hypothetical protein